MDTRYDDDEIEQDSKDARLLALAMQKVLHGAPIPERLTAITMLTAAYAEALGVETPEQVESFIAQFGHTLRIMMEPCPHKNGVH